MTETLPRIVAFGNAKMLAFRDTMGEVHMIATDRLDGIGRHNKRPQCSVVIFTGDRTDDDGFVNEEQIIIPSEHPPEAFLALGLDSKLEEKA